MTCLIIVKVSTNLLVDKTREYHCAKVDDCLHSPSKILTKINI